MAGPFPDPERDTALIISPQSVYAHENTKHLAKRVTNADMAAKAPICVLQMQRMGDLILTFPLLLWLGRRFPGHPIKVVAERLFFEGLLPLSPPAQYIPWEAASSLTKENYRLVVNLSHRAEAAELAGSLNSKEKLGPELRADGATYIHGQWQLYRASLVHNNRHNRFHWADLNSLDSIPLSEIKATAWAEPRQPEKGNGRVGLFLGASEGAKRPQAAFWAVLVNQLMSRGLQPLLLGGPGEKELGAEVARRCNKPFINLCGKFSLGELVKAMETLALLITPDTGPMHLAAWMGIRTLNLSMGPVSPWETGPYQPGHFVLQADLSCVGCWRCTHTIPYLCRKRFTPKLVAGLARRIIINPERNLAGMDLPGMRLFSVGRGPEGLYALTPLERSRPGSAREHVAGLWQAFFSESFGLGAQDKSLVNRPAQEMHRLAQAHPRLESSFRRGLAGLAGKLAPAVRGRGDATGQDFWTTSPPLLRPLTGYLHLLLQNHDFSRQGFTLSLEMVEQVLALIQETEHPGAALDLGGNNGE